MSGKLHALREDALLVSINVLHCFFIHPNEDRSIQLKKKEGGKKRGGGGGGERRGKKEGRRGKADFRINLQYIFQVDMRKL